MAEATHQHINQLIDAIQRFSEQRLREFTGRPELVPTPISNRDVSYDHWISEIRLIYPGIEVGFRTHFSSRMARKLSQMLLGDAQLDPMLCHSFMGEYCNLTAGGLKNLFTDILHARSKEVELSLPDNKPSFDVGLLPDQKNPEARTWKYEIEGEPLICVATLAVDADELSARYDLSVAQLAECLTQESPAPAEPAPVEEADDFDNFLGFAN